MRDFAFEISNDIKQRWSPRAFSSEPIAEAELMALFEAARYAPSCFNEQPWRFVVATTVEELTVMRSILNESNQQWANMAPVLVVVIAKKTFEATGQKNPWHAFDSGTAWGFLALEAQRRGLISHGMGGFDKEKARELLAVPDEFAILAMIAIGKMGNREALSPELRSREEPGLRRPASESVFHGRFR